MGVGALPTTAAATRKLSSSPSSVSLHPPLRLPWLALALAAAEAITPRSNPAALVSLATEHCASASTTCIPLTSLAKRASFFAEMRMFLSTALERSCRCAAVRLGGGRELVEDGAARETTSASAFPEAEGRGSGPGARRRGLRPVTAVAAEGASLSVEKAW